jgi:hypothetical protein
VRIPGNNSSYIACYVWAGPFPIEACAATFIFLIFGLFIDVTQQWINIMYSIGVYQE